MCKNRDKDNIEYEFYVLLTIASNTTFLTNVKSRSCSLYAIASLLSVRLYVTFVRPTQRVKIFRNNSVPLPFGTLTIRRHSRKILRRSSQGNPSVGGFKRKSRGSQI